MKRQTRLFSISIIAVFALFGIKYTNTTKAGTAGSERKQLMIYSEEDMEESSRQSYEKTIAEAKANGTLNKDPATTKRVQTIANKLIAQTSIYRTDVSNWKWQVNVISDPTVNAWCLPGGRIVVYTGIIDSLKLNDAQLAAVIGHEISHALKEHSREQMSREALTYFGASAISLLMGMDRTERQLINLGTELIISLPFSRSQETEADNMGTELMARAGYDPTEAVKVWEKMQKLTNSSNIDILSTHPSNERRIENLTEVSKKVYPLYETSKK